MSHKSHDSISSTNSHRARGGQGDFGDLEEHAATKAVAKGLGAAVGGYLLLRFIQRSAKRGS